MKKIFVIVLCFSMVTVFAAEAADFPESIKSGDIMINGGVGLFNSLTLYNRGTPLVPPLSLSAEYALPVALPLSVGAVIGFANSQRTGGSGDAKFTYTWSIFSIGLKAAYHFDFSMEGLDTYAALTLGADFLNPQAAYNEDVYKNASVKPSAGDGAASFLFGLEIGARFFLNEHFGVFVEEGFSTFTYLRTGVCFKF
jgi:hypothetical protein